MHCIKSVSIGVGENGYCHIVGKIGCVGITTIEKNGEMAKVEWFLISKEDGSYSEVNGKFVSEVVYGKKESA